jgi:hypothetical protein
MPHNRLTPNTVALPGGEGTNSGRGRSHSPLMHHAPALSLSAFSAAAAILEGGLLRGKTGGCSPI